MSVITGEVIMDRKEVLIITVSVASISAFIYFGFGGEIAVISKCESTVSKYVTAEYSETTVGIDMEGNAYTDTDYWSEPASAVNTVTTVNGENIIVNGNFNYTESSGYFSPDMPRHDVSMKSDYDFDNFQFHNDKNLKVSIKSIDTGEYGYFQDPISKTAICIDKLDSHVYIETWYTITYSSDF